MPDERDAAQDEETEVEAHRWPEHGSPEETGRIVGRIVGRDEDDDDDEVEAHRWPEHGAPEDPNSRVG